MQPSAMRLTRRREMPRRWPTGRRTSRTLHAKAVVFTSFRSGAEFTAALLLRAPTLSLTVLYRRRNDTVMALMSVAAAASQMRVSPRRVRAMLASNALSGERIGRQWMIESASLPSSSRRPGQPYSTRVAWAFIELGRGSDPDWVSSSELSRLRLRWRTLRQQEEPVPVVRSVLARRAERSRWSAPEPRTLLRDQRIIASGASDSRAGMSAAQYAEGYVHPADLAAVVSAHMLIPAPGVGNVVLRAVDGFVSSPAPWLAVVADLADGDARDIQQAEMLFAREEARA